MKTIWDKIKELTGTTLFFTLYLVFFGGAVLLGTYCDALKAHPWTSGLLKAIAITHFLGGLAFFIRLCAAKLEIPEDL